MKRKLFLLAASTLLLGGCGGQVNPEPTPGPDPEPTPTPEPMPTYDTDSIQIHYKRNDKKFDSWALWLWKYPDGEGKEYAFNGEDDFGAIASYPLSNWNGCETSGLGFIVKSKGSWDKKDPDGDRIIYPSKLQKDEKKVYHIYLQSGDKNIYTSPELEIMDEIKVAKFENMKRIYVEASSEMSHIKISEASTVLLDIDLAGNKNYRYNFPEGKTVAFDKAYTVQVTFKKNGSTAEAPIGIQSLYKTSAFADEFNYDGELGALYTKESTTFKVWSPVSKNIVVRIFDSGTPKSMGGSDTFTEYKLVKGEKGVFEVKVDGDLGGKYYTYLVSNGNYNRKEVVDPYAKSTGVNGLRGMIVDPEKVAVDGFETMNIHEIDRKKLTVYETHVADITSSSTWTSDANIRKYEKTFKGATISGTTYTEGGVTVKTGFDHIKELGVNAVQLIPVFDQANDETKMAFNWGYNPLNYNTLEGGYSTDPYNGYTRMIEFKELVKAYHDAGMNIIMDVVYNHVNGAAGSNFDVLMPGYYFRYNTDGTLSNGSGCGNETASDMPMMRKFMIDSVCYLAKTYKLGGFRFDLMGLHDIDTMNALAAALKEINPYITVYGEPWQGGTSPLSASNCATQANLSKFQGYGAFNDKGRDALIKGGLNAATAKGWVTNNSGSTAAGDLSAIAAAIKGSTKADTEVNDPNKTVNYVTCHDNYTLYDRIKAAGISDAATIKKMAMLANSVVLTSNGTTFMLAGEEFLRTKGGNNNSYNASYKVNELDYSLKVKNIDMFKNYQKLVALKQQASGLALGTGDNNQVVADTSKGNVISYGFTDSGTGRTYKVFHCNGYNSGSLPTVDLNGYSLYLDTINGSKALSGSTKLEAYETLIAYK